MRYEEYLASLHNDTADQTWPDLLQSLWLDKKGNWDAAHSIAQAVPTMLGSAVHAYLHREEGVLWNADYWYSRAGRKRPASSLETEWEALVRECLKVEDETGKGSA